MGKEEIAAAVQDSPKLIRAMSINRAETFRELLNPTQEILEICEFLRANSEFQVMVSEALDSRFAPKDISELEVEEKIYSGFFESADGHLLDQFQKITWEERAELIKSFKDDRLRQLGQRLVAFYAPELLNNDQKSRFIELLQSRWKATGDDVKWNTKDKVASDLSKMGAEFNLRCGRISIKLECLISAYHLIYENRRKIKAAIKIKINQIKPDLNSQ